MDRNGPDDIDNLIFTEHLCILNLNHCLSVKDVGCQTYTTVSQS